MMRWFVRASLLLLLAVLFVPLGIANAATCDRYDIAAGYTFVHTPIQIATEPSGTGSGTGSTTHLNFNGWNAGAEAKITCMFAIAGDVSGVYNTPPGSNTRVSLYDYLFGPRIFWANSSPVTPFAEALIGGAHASAGSYSSNAFAGAFGGGVDVGITKSLAIRGRVDYLLTTFGTNTHQNNTNVAADLVFRFGHRGEKAAPPPMYHPPTVSCSTDKSMVFVGSGDTVAVTASANSPDNSPLTYTWTTSGGRVDGSGPQVRWLSSGVAAGSYTVSVSVDDGHAGTASCSSSIMVQSRPNHPPTIACAAERSAVFAGERVHLTTNASDPDGDALTYTWRANSGRVIGTGAAVDFDTTGLAPGRYSITVRVDDGKGGAADCTMAVQVNAQPPAPQASKLNECLFNKALDTRVDNVCKRILDDVALRLQNEPRSTAVIIGYSDPKERQSEKIAGDRASNAVKYLGEKGIDASRIKTRTGSGQAGADKENRRVDIILVPEGATY